MLHKNTTPSTNIYTTIQHQVQILHNNTTLSTYIQDRDGHNQRGDEGHELTPYNTYEDIDQPPTPHRMYAQRPTHKRTVTDAHTNAPKSAAKEVTASGHNNT